MVKINPTLLLVVIFVVGSLNSIPGNGESILDDLKHKDCHLQYGRKIIECSSAINSNFCLKKAIRNYSKCKKGLKIDIEQLMENRTQ
ncbi:hypothetical protein JTE90_026756 [Oedothorax gibbosus]|uniref:Uncharacterized protein n=1 Tax=Oedothorax gibbosus TaxID=931172 RepID=A0AAV6UYN5_9ARAC|nr:hypothetical protein JTE90_026756 [Oedothorax gibbosus]